MGMFALITGNLLILTFELDADMYIFVIQIPAAFQTFTVFYHFQYLECHHSDEKVGFYPPVSAR